jgi:hypothetical protein
MESINSSTEKKSVNRFGIFEFSHGSLSSPYVCNVCEMEYNPNYYDKDATI